jgi:hypothetical protein
MRKSTTENLPPLVSSQFSSRHGAGRRVVYKTAALPAAPCCQIDRICASSPLAAESPVPAHKADLAQAAEQ